MRTVIDARGFYQARWMPLNENFYWLPACSGLNSGQVNSHIGSVGY